MWHKHALWEQIRYGQRHAAGLFAAAGQPRRGAWHCGNVSWCLEPARTHGGAVAGRGSSDNQQGPALCLAPGVSGDVGPELPLPSWGSASGARAPPRSSRWSGWPLTEGSTAPLLLVQISRQPLPPPQLLPSVVQFRRAAAGWVAVLLLPAAPFFYVAGTAAAWGCRGELKAAVVTTIGLFLFVGAYGMRQALKVVSDNQLLHGGSLGFLFSPTLHVSPMLFPREMWPSSQAVMLRTVAPLLVSAVREKDQPFSYSPDSRSWWSS